MPAQRKPCVRRRKARGAILFDALIGMGILTFGALSIYSAMPIVSHAQTYANQQTKATQLASRMVENLQMLSKSSLNAASLTQLQLIDANQSGSVLSFTHIPLDDSARYSPATFLPKGTGTLTLTDLPNNSMRARVAITWTSPYGQRTFTTGTVVGGYK